MISTSSSAPRQPHQRRRVPAHPAGDGGLGRTLAAGLFAMLVLACVLLFGGVDRRVQVVLVAGLSVGFLLHPPEAPKLPRLWAWAWGALIVFVAASQFLPAHWFAEPVWRMVLRRDFGVIFPPTRNPEPGRAFDCLLMALLAVTWFYWVRTLACDRGTRVLMVWELFLAAAIVAAVALAMGTRADFMIYGMRYTPGWTGFGPFPNRNHTAALLAMGVLAGAGCLVRAVRRRYWAQVALALVAEVVIFVALLESKSRGGLLGLGCGLALFAVLAISKLRTRSAIVGSVAGGLLCATLIFSFGAKVLSRFEGSGDGSIPNNVRWLVWQDAVRVWQDAPLWGHGLGTFAQIYPVYQSISAPEQLILHPESSWLQWLDEAGAAPVVAGLLFFLYFFGSNAIGAVQTGDRGFFIRAGAFAGVFGLICHGLWDVPVHRWGTAAFGAALLAVACPPLHRRQQVRLGRLWALVPAGAGLYWLLPALGYPLGWSPDTARTLLARAAYTPAAATLGELKAIEAWLPLNPELHEQAGIRELLQAGRQDIAWREFRIADRLMPGSWALPSTQAWLSRDVSPAMSFHFWSITIERGGRRSAELFRAAYRNCSDLPGGEDYWSAYAQAHPEFLLTYAETVGSDEQARNAFGQWWRVRGDTPALVEDWEPPLFHACVRKWGTAEQLRAWMSRRPECEARDFWAWADILHQWHDDAAAWRLLSAHEKEPALPPDDGASLALLEAKFRDHPDDAVDARYYVQQCLKAGNTARAEQVILTVAAGREPPPWFVQRAAYLYAARQDYDTAVTCLLRLMPR